MSELRVDSRWWYWVAVVPVITTFWLLSAVWVAVVVLVVPEASTPTTSSAVVSIPAVALGVPALVAFLVLPLALIQDSRAVEEAGGRWSGLAEWAAQLAVGVDLALLAGIYLFFEGDASVVDPDPLGTLLIGIAVLAGTWLCVRYLRERASVVAMPTSLREWRSELRGDATRR
ncbi:hypothetical protein [Halobacterium wangiae]|uniref:hypothetical protein n=1 Tax=Halobacterium wangiae TaxID=2902623 RepID=UPI001E2988C4|nr:hypothetical protein [Halobacterium wangiae]